MIAEIFQMKKVVLAQKKICSSAKKGLALIKVSNAIQDQIAKMPVTRKIARKNLVLWQKIMSNAILRLLVSNLNGFATDMTTVGTIQTKKIALKMTSKMRIFVRKNPLFNAMMENASIWIGFVTMNKIVRMEVTKKIVLILVARINSNV